VILRNQTYHELPGVDLVTPLVNLVHTQAPRGTLAVLAMRTGVPVIPVFMVREGFHRHRVLIRSPLEIVQSGDVRRDVETNTLRINQTLESVIRLYPDQWFWVHRRWERKKRVHNR
jgi:lauroyl/myristoyl acyltransferase